MGSGVVLGIPTNQILMYTSSTRGRPAGFVRTPPRSAEPTYAAALASANPAKRNPANLHCLCMHSRKSWCLRKLRKRCGHLLHQLGQAPLKIGDWPAIAFDPQRQVVPEGPGVRHRKVSDLGSAQFQSSSHRTQRAADEGVHQEHWRYSLAQVWGRSPCCVTCAGHSARLLCDTEGQVPAPSS